MIISSVSGGSSQVEATNPLHVDAAQTARPGSLEDVSKDRQYPKGRFRLPTAEELSGLTFGPLHEIRIHAQELRNQFANLLNRGSSLE